jgi:spore germination cell wall hydrolase CwlJ-like protein
MKNILRIALFIFSFICLGLAVSGSPIKSQADTLPNKTESSAPGEEQNSDSVECLAKNIYFESRGSNLADMAAVADVVLNRTKDRRYPETVCGVVYQARLAKDGSPLRNQCQFSWYCDGLAEKMHNQDKWELAQTIAYQMLHESKYRGISEGATHYHATYVKPYWTTDKGMTLVGRIGEHIFYRLE